MRSASVQALWRWLPAQQTPVIGLLMANSTLKGSQTLCLETLSAFPFDATLTNFPLSLLAIV